MPIDDTDTTAEPGATRLREFARQEREAGIHPAIEALHRRPVTRSGDNRKAVEYARIERGRTS